MCAVRMRCDEMVAPEAQAVNEIQACPCSRSPFLVTAGWYKCLLSPTIKRSLKQMGLERKLQKKGLIFNLDQVSDLSLSSTLSYTVV